MPVYEITYQIDIDDFDFGRTYCECETFTGYWDDLQEYIKELKRNGAYRIDAACIKEEDEDDY